jgi:hypothetical protein
MNRILMVALAGAGLLIAQGACAADARPNGAYTSRVAYRAYAPTPRRSDMRDYRFTSENGGYEQEYKIGRCHVKRELEEDGAFTEEVHCRGRED